ncbi:MAG TPA: hypothetical protein VGM09_25210 [Bradyrhizobium sp.]|jgi:hypothetical protein
MVPQDLRLLTGLLAAESMARIKAGDRRDRAVHAREILEEIGLGQIKIGRALYRLRCKIAARARRARRAA